MVLKRPTPDMPRPAAAVGLGAAPTAEQDITLLRKRYEKLNRDKAVAEANLTHARDKLEELKQMAREQYGTDDLDALKAKLAQMRQDNEQKRAAYQQALDQIETDLQAVETRYQQSLQSDGTER